MNLKIMKIYLNKFLKKMNISLKTINIKLIRVIYIKIK